MDVKVKGPHTSVHMVYLVCNEIAYWIVFTRNTYAVTYTSKINFHGKLEPMKFVNPCAVLNNAFHS